jgi:hypothetical protein
MPIAAPNAPNPSIIAAAIIISSIVNSRFQ